MWIIIGQQNIWRLIVHSQKKKKKQRPILLQFIIPMKWLHTRANRQWILVKDIEVDLRLSIGGDELQEQTLACQHEKIAGQPQWDNPAASKENYARTYVIWI